MCATATRCSIWPAAPAIWRGPLRSKVGSRGMVVHTDINEAMLRQGRERLEDDGLLLPTLLCDAETLPFASDSFDLRDGGLRPAQHDAQGSRAGRDEPRAASRVAACWCSSSRRSPSRWKRSTTGIRSASCRGIGKLVAGDADSYRYLAESIRVHPGPAELKAMMKTAGFGHVDVHPMTAGVVALHVGIKC